MSEVAVHEALNTKKKIIKFSTIHTIKPINTLIFLHIICHKSEMFRSILNVFKELLNGNKVTHPFPFSTV